MLLPDMGNPERPQSDKSARESVHHHSTATRGSAREETLEMRQSRPLTDNVDILNKRSIHHGKKREFRASDSDPGAEAQAHAPNEKTWKQDLVTCAACIRCTAELLLRVTRAELL